MHTIKEILNNITYPGRGIIVGLSKSSLNLALAYFIMGRSLNSKNRMFVFKKNKIVTKPIYNDVKNSELLIYTPVLKFKNFIIISNGNSTDTIAENLNLSKSFETAMNSRNFENDPPIFTPRIAALVNLNKNKPALKMAIVKKSNKWLSTNRFFYNYDVLQPGYGYFIHTYSKNDSCLQNTPNSFNSEPHCVKIADDLAWFQEEIWNSMNSDYKISLYTEFLNLRTKQCTRKIVNKKPHC